MDQLVNIVEMVKKLERERDVDNTDKDTSNESVS
jgi:hypothetical protein